MNERPSLPRRLAQLAKAIAGRQSLGARTPNAIERHLAHPASASQQQRMMNFLRRLHDQRPQGVTMPTEQVTAAWADTSSAVDATLAEARAEGFRPGSLQQRIFLYEEVLRSAAKSHKSSLTLRAPESPTTSEVVVHGTPQDQAAFMLRARYANNISFFMDDVATAFEQPEDMAARVEADLLADKAFARALTSDIRRIEFDRSASNSEVWMVKTLASADTALGALVRSAAPSLVTPDNSRIDGGLDSPL